MIAAAVAARQSDLDEAEADAERARSAAAGLQRPPLDTDALRAPQRLLSQAHRLEAELGTRRDLLRSEEEQLAGLRSRSHEGGAEGRSTAVPPALIYGLALAGIAGIAAGVVLSGNSLWPGVGAGSVLFAVAIVLHFVSTSTPEPTGGRQRTEIWVTQPVGNRKAPRELSRGTREQLYISLRFGLIRNLGEQQECLPVIVDDVLVNFDPDRAARAAEAFAQLAETHQVLVLTCHSTTVERFLAAAPRAHILNLEGKEASFPVVAGGVPNDG